MAACGAPPQNLTVPPPGLECIAIFALVSWRWLAWHEMGAHLVE